METSPVHRLRMFVSERLTVAAEEIFGVFVKTLSEYEEEILRQRRLLDITLKPAVLLQKTDHRQPSLCIEGPPPDQERRVCLGVEDSEPPRIKEEQEELCTLQEEEAFAPQQHAGDMKLSPAYEEHDHGDDQTQCSDPVPTKESRRNSSNKRTHAELYGKPPVVPDQNRGPVRRAKANRRSKALQQTPHPVALDTSADLRLHARTHASKKPYSCKFCKKEFAFSSSVSRHLRVHTGEKPYECPLCGKRFNVSTTLKVHFRIHTGEKPYKCKACERAFTTCSNLKKHMALHNKGAKSRLYD